MQNLGRYSESILSHFIAVILSLAFATFTNAREPNEISFGHYPMILVNADETTAHFNLLVPQNKNYELRLRPAGRTDLFFTKGNIIAKGIRDPGNLLHQSVLKISFEDLIPNSNYELQLVEVSRFGELIVDERKFSTFNQKGRGLKFVTGSCMSDEIAYEKPRRGITAEILKQSPEVIFLTGDEVYVDAFDYVDRSKVTDTDVWIRYYRSFETNPLFRSQTLIPTISTWDDHDTGVDNANRHTRTIVEARRAFLSLFGDVETSDGGNGGIHAESVHRIVTLRGQNFILLDNRSFREAPDPTSRFGHLGQMQEEWLLEKMKTTPGFFWLIAGGVWGAETFAETKPDGFVKRLTEGFHGDHPLQYRMLMEKIHELNVPYALISGDIHVSQIVEHSPRFINTPRYSPFPTLEITASPMFSFIFPTPPGQPSLWPDPHRITGIRNYNFVVVNSENVEGGIELDATSIGATGERYFHHAARITRKPSTVTLRRRITASLQKLLACRKLL